MTDVNVLSPPEEKNGLTGNLLKWIAITCMLLDHIAWAFLPLSSPLAVILHTVGRITGPVMFFFIAEGFFRTRSVGRYALRLLLFTLLSWPCFSLFESGAPFFPRLGVIWSLLLGLLALWACRRFQNVVLRVLAAAGCCILSVLGDWPVFSVLYILAFGLNRENKRMQLFWYLVVSSPMLLMAVWGIPAGDFSSLYQLGVLLPLPLLFLYNGERGGKPWMKWAFYLFYPVHLLLLYFIRVCVTQ